MAPFVSWRGSRGIVSLWDMIELGLISEAAALGSSLHHQTDLYRGLGATPLPPTGQRVTTAAGIILERDGMMYSVATTTQACKKWGLNSSMVMAFNVETWIRGSRDGTFLELVGRLDGLMHSIMDEAAFRLCLIIPADLSRYVNQEEPLGDAVYGAFPSARTDLAEAGNCLAFGCNTAAAFHLMRAAEIGLWELGRDRQIPLAKSGKIESTQWGTIIDELVPAVTAIKQWPNSATKEEAHKFYNTALVEIRAFNDGWRRHAAHVRPQQPPMAADEARTLWGHVSRFLSTLATKISEGHYTSLVW